MTANKLYQISQLASLSGISVNALHHYDAIGIRLHVYDDTGMDVHAIAAAPLLCFYERFDAWFLDYYRERMRAAFAGGKADVCFPPRCGVLAPCDKSAG